MYVPYDADNHGHGPGITLAEAALAPVFYYRQTGRPGQG
jgi:hypothetical protein